MSMAAAGLSYAGLLKRPSKLSRENESLTQD
jgi:hypothetical protein